MIEQIPFFAIFGFFIAEFGHAFNTFDSVHFFPARRSYYAGDGFYERKWMSCVQELQELKLQHGIQHAQNYGYHSTVAPYGGSGERKAKKEAKDSYEIIYPPNYKPAYKYEKLRIADVIYPLKLRQAYHPYQVPTYPRQQSGGYGAVENNNGNYAINGNNKPEEGYGHAENEGKSEEHDGYRKDKMPEEQLPNYNSANENSGNDEKEVPPPPDYKTSTPYIQPAGAPPEVADNNYEQEMPEKEPIPEKSTHENYGDGKEENDGHGHSEEEEGANDVNAEMQQHFDHQSDEPYGSAAEEEEAEAEEEAENFGSEQQSDENDWEEENENDGQEDDDGEDDGQYSKEQHGDGEHTADSGAPEESNPPQSVGDQTNQGGAGILPAANGGQPQSAAITDPQQQQQQQMAEQQQQQSMPKQNEAPQTEGDGQPQNTTTTTMAPAAQSTTSTSTTQNSNVACRMEPIEQCSARARCTGESQQTSLDCTTMGDDMIFDTVTQDCKSILGVPECAKEQFCVGKTLGWTLVGGQCAKVSYLCGLAQESDQQSSKLICSGSEVVNPEMPGQCTVRTMVAGC